MTLGRFEDVDLALGRMASRVGVVEREMGNLKKEIGNLKDDVLSVKKALRRTTGKIRDIFDYVGEVDTMLSRHQADRKAHLPD